MKRELMKKYDILLVDVKYSNSVDEAEKIIEKHLVIYNQCKKMRKLTNKNSMKCTFNCLNSMEKHYSY